MAHKINEKAKKIQNAYGVNLDHIDSIGQRMAEICAMAQDGQEPSGFIAKKVQDIFSKDDLEIIATMFAIKVINEENMKAREEGCQCPGCRAARGEDADENDMTAAIQEALQKEFPGLEAQVIRVPKDKNGKTNC